MRYDEFERWLKWFGLELDADQKTLAYQFFRMPDNSERTRLLTLLSTFELIHAEVELSKK